MTDIEALEKTILIWDWLAQHPDASKLSAYQALDLTEDDSACPLCIQATPEGETCADCILCLLHHIWPDGCWVPPDSPYYIWQYGPVFQSIAGAQAIADAARIKLSEVERDLY